MSLRLKILKTVLGATAVAMLATAPSALGQAATPVSVLPTGGGLALIDTSDSVLLLLDHQSGLFQTVKDVNRHRASQQHRDVGEAGDAPEDSRHHHRLRAQRA